VWDEKKICDQRWGAATLHDRTACVKKKGAEPPRASVGAGPSKAIFRDCLHVGAERDRNLPPVEVAKDGRYVEAIQEFL